LGDLQHQAIYNVYLFRDKTRQDFIRDASGRDEALKSLTTVVETRTVFIGRKKYQKKAASMKKENSI
jgi:hypothetical protein